PFVVAPVGLSPNSLAHPADPFGMAERALVEGVDLDLQSVEVELADQVALELARSLVADALTPVGGRDREGAHGGDRGASVDALPGRGSHPLALDREDHHAEVLRLGERASDLDRELFLRRRAKRGEE